MINNICNGNFLLKIYDWSMQILGAVGSSVSHLLLRLTKSPEKSNARKRKAKKSKHGARRTRSPTSSSSSSVFWPSPKRESQAKVHSQAVFYCKSDLESKTKSTAKFRSYPSLEEPDIRSIPSRKPKRSHHGSLV